MGIVIQTIVLASSVIQVVLINSGFAFQPDEIVPCTEELLLAIFQLQLGDMPPTGEQHRLVVRGFRIRDRSV